MAVPTIAPTSVIAVMTVLPCAAAVTLALRESAADTHATAGLLELQFKFLLAAEFRSTEVYKR
ncbi:hypothetical protein D3C81_2320230 [compost metagenome]